MWPPNPQSKTQAWVDLPLVYSGGLGFKRCDQTKLYSLPAQEEADTAMNNYTKFIAQPITQKLPRTHNKKQMEI